MAFSLASDFSYEVLKLRTRRQELSAPSLHKASQPDNPGLAPYIPTQHVFDPGWYLRLERLPETRTDSLGVVKRG